GRAPRVKFHDRHDEEDWTVTLADTGEDSLTGRRLRLVRRYIEPGETFLLTYGDGLTDLDIAASVAEHRRAGRAATITAVHPAGRFGALSLDDDGRIHTFQEKPQVEAAYVNGGYMVGSDRGVEFIPEENVAFEREPITRLVAAGELHSFQHEGWWQPMDTWQEMQYLNQLWHEGRAPWKRWP
ncbi:MAG TPA: sugar phosphate nucleotidyltransferase, partial [Verrucomicrobiota bacterium]|nr:sugar phosphate nucleotidyltransferase [Verrucomicrobiota bacterium]